MRIFLVLSLWALFMWAGCDNFDIDNNKTDRQVPGANLHDKTEGDDSDDNTDDRKKKCKTKEGDDGSNDEDEDEPQCDEQAALAAFQLNIQPSIDKACYMCHASSAGGLTMEQQADDEDEEMVAQNRLNLKASAESVSAENLFLKISNQSEAGHGGGDQSDPNRGNLTLAKIKAWLAAEVGCD